MINRLHQQYQEKIVPELLKSLGLGHKMAVPKVTKIIVSTAFREAQHQDEAIKNANGWLSTITGQKPLVTHAHTSISAFNVREGDELGLKVTLRGVRMWEFLDKLISTALPRIKDFQGISRTGFDGHGNYTLGLTEQIIFPEIEYDSIDKVRGLQVTIVTTARTDEQALKLLAALGMPFQKESEVKGRKHG